MKPQSWKKKLPKTSENTVCAQQDCCILKKGKTSACKETCTYKVQKLSPVINSFKMDGGQVENSCGLTNQKFKSFLEIFTNCILPAKEEGNSQTWLFTRKPQTTFCIYCKPTALHESPRWLSPDLSPFDGQRKIVKWKKIWQTRPQTSSSSFEPLGKHFTFKTLVAASSALKHRLLFEKVMQQCGKHSLCPNFLKCVSGITISRHFY